jgi:hypothetical protein
MGSCVSPAPGSASSYKGVYKDVSMNNRSLSVNHSIAIVGIAVRRLRLLANKRDLAQGRDALARFENEGGAIARRPALTPEVIKSRSDK